jgi:hypothetical protein
MGFGNRKQAAKDGLAEGESVDPQTGAVVSNVKSKEERAFVRRLDMFLMTFGCLSQIIKYLGMSYVQLKAIRELIAVYILCLPHRSNQYLICL